MASPFSHQNRISLVIMVANHDSSPFKVSNTHNFRTYKFFSFVVDGERSSVEGTFHDLHGCKRDLPLVPYIALCWFIKKKKKKTVQETDIVHVDEHLKVKEAIVPGTHGPQAVILSVEEDMHIDEEIRKNEKDGKSFHAKPAEGSP